MSTCEEVSYTRTKGKTTQVLQDMKRPYVRYIIEYVGNNVVDSVTKYYYYSAVHIPTINDNVAYTVMIELFDLMSYYDNWVSLGTLPNDVYGLFNDKLLYVYEVEIVLCILCTHHMRTLHTKLHMVSAYNSNNQDNDVFVTPDTNSTISDYTKMLIHYMPQYLGIALPDRLLTHKFVAYPYIGITPKYDNSWTRVVDDTGIIDTTSELVCGQNELHKRVDKHIPMVFKDKAFPWYLVYGDPVYSDSNHMDIAVDRFQYISKPERKVGTAYAGCAVAGGYLQSLATNKVYESGTYTKSDIDVFIYGNSGDSYLLLVKLLDLLKQYGYTFTNVKCRDANKTMLINATLQGTNLIQIVCTSDIHFYHVIYAFDHSAVQIAYDGKDVYVTPDYTYHCTLGQSMLFPPYVRVHRILKVIDRGYIPVVDKMIYINSRLNVSGYKYDADGIYNSTNRINTNVPNTVEVPLDMKNILFSIMGSETYYGRNTVKIGQVPIGDVSNYIVHVPVGSHMYDVRNYVMNVNQDTLHSIRLLANCSNELSNAKSLDDTRSIITRYINISRPTDHTYTLFNNTVIFNNVDDIPSISNVMKYVHHIKYNDPNPYGVHIVSTKAAKIMNDLVLIVMCHYMPLIGIAHHMSRMNIRDAPIYGIGVRKLSKTGIVRYVEVDINSPHSNTGVIRTMHL